jgi:hypothetical protein
VVWGCAAACGAWAGGCSEFVEVFVGVGVRVAEALRLLAEAGLAVLPGKALAAASANSPVSTTLPAMSQRFSRLSSRSAASRVWVVWIAILIQWWW